MRFSEHDRDAIEDVAAFCTTDPDRGMLAAVWIGDGWAMGTDSYRLDLREVDTDWSGAVDPITFRPVRFDKGFDGRWKALHATPRRDVTSIRLTAAALPTMRIPASKFRVICLGCLAYSEELTYAGPCGPCGCEDPIVNLAYLRQALAHFDEPPWVRWESSSPLRAVRIEEAEHFHILMPVRRSA